MTGRLEICACGHTRDEHHAVGRCTHAHAASVKLGPPALCSCSRYQPDDRLTDTEAFIGRVLEKVLAKEAIPVEAVEREDALQLLRIQLWRTTLKYDSRSHVRFRVYAYLELYNDAIDHFRSERGRHGQHRVFDARHAPELDGDGDVAAQADRLDGAASRDPADDPDAWAADAGGLLAVGDGAPARDPRRAGRDDAQGARRRDRRAVPAAPERARPAAAGARRPAPRAAFLDCPACGWRNYLDSPNGTPGWHPPDACTGCGSQLGPVEPRP